MNRRRPGAFSWFGGAMGLVYLASIVVACGGSNNEQQVVQGGNAYTGQSAPQPGPYAQQPAMGTPSTAQQGYAGGPPPGQYAPNATSQPSATPAPSPLAPSCQNDFICGTHRCNLQTGRCALPCASGQDCQPGFTCLGAGGPTAICVPGGGS